MEGLRPYTPEEVAAGAMVPVMLGGGYMLVLKSKDGKTCRLFSSKDLDPKEEESCGMWFDIVPLRRMLRTYLETVEGKEYAGRLEIWCVHFNAHAEHGSRPSFPVLHYGDAVKMNERSLHPYERTPVTEGRIDGECEVVYPEKPE